MATPTVPTQYAIITEALENANAQGFYARARDYWIQEIFNDIWNRALTAGNSRLKTLLTFEVQITTIGQSKYDFPSDFDEVTDISILDGDHLDTVSTQTVPNASTVIYAVDEDATETEVVGAYTLLTSGPGMAQLRQNIAYNTSTFKATIDRIWQTNPMDYTTTYLIVNQTTPLEQSNLKSLGSLGANTSTGKPVSYAIAIEGVDNRFILDKPPDLATYGLLVRYYANIHSINLTESGTLISAIYQNWQHILRLGIYKKALEANLDSRLSIAQADYETTMANLLLKEMPYEEEFQGFIL